MGSNNIFIHVPKTGGSSFVRTLQIEVLKENTFSLDNTHVIKKILNIDIKHVDFSHPNRPMRDSDIFAKYKLYKDYNIFTIIRNPLERLISEFIFQYHILKPKWKAARIINSLVPRPTTFEEYVKHMEVWNYQLAFLSGRGLADKNKPNQKDLDNIIYHFNKYPVYCGITDNYDEFINLFNKKSGYEIKNIHKMKEAPNDIKIGIYNSLSQELIDYIKKTNSLDYKLYEYAKKSQSQHP
jgi:hypothetical protein